MLSNEKNFLIKLPKQQKNNRYYPRTNDIIINKPKQKFREKVYSTNLTFLESAQSDTKQGSSVPQYAGSFSDSHASPFLFHFFLLFSISFILSRSLSLSSASLSFSLSLFWYLAFSFSVYWLPWFIHSVVRSLIQAVIHQLSLFVPLPLPSRHGFLWCNM